MHNQKLRLFGIIFLFPLFIQSGDNLSKSQPITIPNNNRNINFKQLNDDFELGYQASRSQSPSSPPSLGHKSFHALFTEYKKTHNLHTIRVSPDYSVNKNAPSPVSRFAAAALMNTSSPNDNQLRTSQK